jgi:hypothetical protein
MDQRGGEVDGEYKRKGTEGVQLGLKLQINTN